jgi:exopolysaccharide biosynthesis polyprenyl glycosylphosphotransferase
MLTIAFLREKPLDSGQNYFEAHIKLFSVIFPIWILVYFIEGLYSLRTYNPALLPLSIIRGTFVSSLISFVVIYFFPKIFGSITPKTNLLAIALCAAPLLFGWRKYFFSYFAKERRLRGTLLIGSRSTLELATYELNRKPYLGYKIIAALTPEEAKSYSLGSDFDLVAIERNITQDVALYRQYFDLLSTGTEVMDLAKFTERISGKIPLAAIDESWFVEYCGHTESRSYDILKSLIDRFFAVLLLVAILPLFLVLLPVLFLFHGRPIFFTQVRTGMNNKPFTLYKLRSMVVDAEKGGAQWAKPGDARITPLGKFLRKSRLDELPQLINILKGEMSLVGPRPERPEIIEAKLAPKIPYYNLRHLVKPGVTGWAQVTFRYGFSTEDSLEKLQYDLFYVKNKNLWLDILVIVKTIKTVLTGAGQ